MSDVGVSNDQDRESTYAAARILNTLVNLVSDSLGKQLDAVDAIDAKILGILGWIAVIAPALLAIVLAHGHRSIWTLFGLAIFIFPIICLVWGYRVREFQGGIDIDATYKKLNGRSELDAYQHIVSDLNSMLKKNQQPLAAKTKWLNSGELALGIVILINLAIMSVLFW